MRVTGFRSCLVSENHIVPRSTAVVLQMARVLSLLALQTLVRLSVEGEADSLWTVKGHRGAVNGSAVAGSNLYTVGALRCLLGATAHRKLTPARGVDRRASIRAGGEGLSCSSAIYVFPAPAGADSQLKVFGLAGGALQHSAPLGRLPLAAVALLQAPVATAAHSPIVLAGSYDNCVHAYRRAPASAPFLCLPATPPPPCASILWMLILPSEGAYFCAVCAFCPSSFSTTQR